MRHKLAIGFLLLAQLHSVLTKSHYTHLGTPCLTDCEKKNNIYTCTSIQGDGHYASSYCSPEEGLDYQGRKCKQDTPCNQYGYGYYWCYVVGSLTGWGYCGLVKTYLEHLTATYHIPCKDQCDQRESTSYYWCETWKGWDYCSPEQGLDMYGRRCKSDHPCDYHGDSTKYTWCYLENGSWEKCGKVYERDLLYISSSYNLICQDDCTTYGYDYFWCNTLKGWDYCSPVPDVTYKKEPCRSDHKCGLNDESYNWCWTEKSWDYCGPIAEGECAYTVQNTFKESSAETGIICTITDRGNRRQVIFFMQATTDLLFSGPYLNTAYILISRWHNSLLPVQPRSELLVEGFLRIDLQGFIVREERRYYNLQIQINGRRPPGQSTSIAQIIIPTDQDIPERYFRRAFTESLLQQARVTVEVRDCRSNC
ncbi:uncharacterized protein LOC120527975 [Polypterus senegalus]|uniref:uncharacterized protein LOC120527975 n=1 Tax=Polypterus senegalus TaxID=55291 RepID=UPI001966017A|nr:uncharacterized protein LOC120527975 [Polypterus senegalus]